MPKGHLTTKGLAKEAAREYVRQRVTAEMAGLLDAQVAHAKGIRHTFLRDENGRFVQLTDPKQIETALNSGDEGKYYWTFTKDPSTQAFTDLMNRAIDKPKEQEQTVVLIGEDALEARLKAGRARTKKT
jgi:hypothetical protein